MDKNNITIKNVENLYFIGSRDSIPAIPEEKAVEKRARKASGGLFMKWIEFILMLISLSGKAVDPGINVFEGKNVGEGEVKAEAARFGSDFKLSASFQAEYESVNGCDNQAGEVECSLRRVQGR